MSKTDQTPDNPKRSRAWYYARTRQGPVTESRGLVEGIAYAQGRAKAGEMMRELKQGGRAPKSGASLRACGFDGEPDHEAMIEAQRAAGDDAWFEYVGRWERDRFQIHPLDN